MSSDAEARLAENELERVVDEILRRLVRMELRTSAEPVAVEPQLAADMLGVGRTMVFQLIRAGELESFTVGRKRLIPVAAIHRFVQGRVEAQRR